MKFCVLLSAYNGEKYIREQLDSIFSQDFPNGEIIVVLRDDGSTDNTISICIKYAQEKSRNLKIIRGENLGPAASFITLINSCPLCDYYAFCDQDDVWMQGKVMAAVDKLDCEQPVLWTSEYSVTDSNLKVIKEKNLKSPEMDPVRVLFYNNVPGCVMVFNQALLLEMRKMEINQFRMHDIFALNIALQFGKVFFDKHSYLLYRQHDGNVLGYGNKKINLKYWLRDKIKYLMSDESHYVSEYAAKMLEVNKARLSEERIRQYEIIKNYKNGFISTIRLFRQKYTHDGINRTAISIRCKILLRKM